MRFNQIFKESRYKIKECPKYGELKVLKRFALFPKYMDDLGCYVWLEIFYRIKKFEKGAGSIRMRGAFQNYYNDVWVNFKAVKNNDSFKTSTQA